MAKQHIIELNGKRYDALTGKMVTNQSTTQSSHKTPLKPVTTNNMDGFAKSSLRSSHVPQPHQRAIQKSHTLMRKTVNKPVSHKLHAVATIVDQKQPHQPISQQESVLR
ncbi:MAG TPA: hypothetical protein VM124_00955, partial [Candidatus Limnocylindrales bacterium]|nr:hypothetical protein [Candidatus Limnocylindrales bacterium]